MSKRALLSLCAAVLLLCGGIGLGRYATLRGGAVLRAPASPGAGLSALTTAPARPDESEEAAWRVSINRAGEAELQELPGIGPAIAGRIVAYRREHGDFESPEEIMAVRGIGEAVFAKIKDYITLD